MRYNGTYAPSSGRALAASIGKNTFFGVTAGVVHMAARFLVVPVIIRYLGLDGYGIWAVLMTVAAYMSLGAAGVKSAFQKYVAEATGDGDFDRASRLLSTGAAAVLVISVLALIPLAVFAHSLAVAVGIPSKFLQSASKAILLLAVTAVFTNIGQTYQSILMGAHRIDLRDKLGIALEAFSVLAIIAVLRAGYGLLAMSAIFGLQEILSSILCYLTARHVLPSVRLGPQFVSRSAIREVVRFAGSYQLVSVLELLYAAVLPVATLKFFGADSAGIYALCVRLVAAAALAQGAFLQSILSGGSLVYASKAIDQIHAFIVRSFKAMWVISVIPLAFVAVYSTKLALIWTGQRDPRIRETVWLLCAAGLCRSLSSLGRVLYRISGGAIMDNLQLILMLIIALALSPFGRELGFFGMISGIAVLGQFLGLILICMTLTKRFQGFSPRILAPDLIKCFAATATILGASLLASYLGIPWKVNTRLLDVIKLLTAIVVGLGVAGPALMLTGSVSRTEAHTMLHAVWRRPAPQA